MRPNSWWKGKIPTPKRWMLIPVTYEWSQELLLCHHMHSVARSDDCIHERERVSGSVKQKWCQHVGDITWWHFVWRYNFMVKLTSNPYCVWGQDLWAGPKKTGGSPDPTRGMASQHKRALEVIPKFASNYEPLLWIMSLEMLCWMLLAASTLGCLIWVGPFLGPFSKSVFQNLCWILCQH